MWLASFSHHIALRISPEVFRLELHGVDLLIYSSNKALVNRDPHSFTDQLPPIDTAIAEDAVKTLVVTIFPRIAVTHVISLNVPLF